MPLTTNYCGLSPSLFESIQQNPLDFSPDKSTTMTYTYFVFSLESCFQSWDFWSTVGALPLQGEVVVNTPGTERGYIGLLSTQRVCEIAEAFEAKGDALLSIVRSTTFDELMQDDEAMYEIEDLGNEAPAILSKHLSQLIDFYKKCNEDGLIVAVY